MPMREEDEAGGFDLHQAAVLVWVGKDIFALNGRLSLLTQLGGLVFELEVEIPPWSLSPTNFLHQNVGLWRILFIFNFFFMY